MARPSVAIRLATEGKAQVKNDFAEIAQAGDVTTKRLVANYDEQARAAEAALARAARTAEKIASIAPQTDLQAQIMRNSGTVAGTGAFDAARSGGFDGSGRSARESATALKELIAEQERAEAQARQMLAAIDPLYAAQLRYDAELAKATELHRAGALSAEQYALVLRSETVALDAAREAALRHGTAVRGNGMIAVQAGAQVQDFFIQVQGGQSILVAASQQVSQLAFVMQGAQGSAGRFAGFMTSGWGTALLAGVSVLSLIIPKLLDTENATEKATKQLKDHAKEADATAAAQERWKYTIEGLIEASRKLEDQTKHLNESSREAASRAIAEAGATLQLTINKREAAKATLEQAKAELAWRDARAQDPDSGPGAAMAAAWTETKIKEIEEQIRDLDTAIGTDKAAIAELEISKARREAGAAADAATQANEAYADSVDRIEYAYRRSARTAADYKAMVDALAKAGKDHKAALDAARASDRDPTQTRFAAPLRSMNVAHPFSEPRGGRNHAGVDLSAGVGTPVFADAPGIARRKNDPKGYGYYIEIDHGRGVKSRFAHLSEYLVEDGARVEQGQQIALSGGARGAPGSGNSKDPHLHYEIRIGGKPVNPIGGAFGIDPLAASSGGISREEALRRQVEAMETSAKGALLLAEAYLTSGEAAVRAEAQREGATDAIRSGAEAEAQVRRQLNLDVAEGAAQGAKAVAQMRGETDARRTVNDGVSSGAIAVADMNRVLGEEAALRPLLKLQSLAQGDALATLTKVIDAYRKALADAHDEEARGEALAAIDAAGKRIDDIRASIPLVGDPRAREIDEARRAAIREADAKGLKPTDIERTDLIDARVEEVRAQHELRRAEYIADANRNHADSIALLERELDLRGLDGQARERSLKLLDLELQLNRELGPEHEEQIRDLLRKAEAEEALRAEVEKVRSSLDEARQIGEDFVDTVFDPRNWQDWGDLGKRILAELAEDFIRLAILNPIKNEAFGQNNPTLGSVLAQFGSFFGGEGSSAAAAGADAGFWDSLGASIGSNAMGTEYWRGGLTEVGENGKELLELPRGAKIKPAAETRRLLAANDAGMTIKPTWNINAPGADPAAIMRLERMMTDYSEQFGENVVAAVNDGISRRLIVGG